MDAKKAEIDTVVARLEKVKPSSFCPKLAALQLSIANNQDKFLLMLSTLHSFQLTCLSKTILSLNIFLKCPTFPRTLVTPFHLLFPSIYDKESFYVIFSMKVVLSGVVQEFLS